MVFRDGDEIYTQSRDLKPLDRYFPELAAPLMANIPERCVLDGEIVISRDGALEFELLLLRIHPAASRVKMLAEESPASFVAWDILALDDEDLRETPQGERRARLEAVLGSARPPVHLTPATLDRDTAADWFDRFEGPGLDGVVAKRLDAPYQPGKRAMFKIKHQRTADCVVAGFRWHKNGPGTHVGSLLLGLFDDEGTLHHVGVTSSFTWDKREALAAELAPLREDALARHPWKRLGRVGGLRRGRRLRPAAPRRDLALEPRQGPLLGAAPRGARGRGRLRPPPGRPVPARDDVQALAAGQGAGRLPLRPARGDGGLRDRPDLRRVRVVTIMAGAAAIGSGVVQVGAFFLGGLGLTEEQGVLLWNLLLIPAALVLGISLFRRAPVAATIATVSGVVSCSLWAAAAASGGSSTAIPEWSWIGLSAVWWLALGIALWPGHRRLGGFTFVVGLAALGDVAVTFPGSVGVDVPAEVFGTVGGFKLPLALVWAFVIGAAMVAGAVGRLPSDDADPEPALATGQPA